MNKMDVVKLGLTEGDLITKDSIDLIEDNLNNMKARVDSIVFAEQMDKVDDIVSAGVNDQKVVEGLEKLVAALKAKGFMSNV